MMRILLSRERAGNGGSPRPHADEEITRFLAALFEDSARCDLYYLWENIEAGEKKRKSLVDFADLIAKKIRLVV